MSQTLFATLGIASGAVNIVGQIPYLLDTVRGKTKPERATWWIWLALNAIAFSAQYAAGARWSLFLTGGQLVSTLLTAVLSVRYGYGAFHRKDLISILIAMGGILLWKFTKSPLAALLLVILVDTIGFWLTLEKSWKAPRTETLITWIIASISGTLGVLSVGGFGFTKLVYPFYIMLGNWLLVFVIISRRRSVAS